MLSFVSLLSLVNTLLTVGQIVSKSGSAQCPCATESSLGSHSVSGFPQTYGIGCDYHDLQLNADCKRSDAPIWCSAAWCYVDVEQCLDHDFGIPGVSRKLPTTISSTIVGREWSYETCGYVDTFTLNQLERTMINSTVTVVVLTNSGGWRGSYCSDETRCRGPTLNFVLQVLRRAQVDVKYVSRSTGSRYINGSSVWPSQEVLRQVWADNPKQTSLFQMCAYATGMGYIDVCVGSFSITSSRTQLSHFLEVYTEPVYLVSKISYPTTTLWEYIETPLSPFQPSLWLAVLLSLFVIACLMVWHERVQGGAFYELRIWEAGASSVFEVLMSIFSAASTYQLTTSASKTTALGLAFFILIIITSYTAELASHLLARANPESVVHGMEYMISQDQRICMVKSLEEPLLQLYPLASHLPVVLPSRSDILPALEEGRCAAGLMLREDFDESADTCRYTLVGEPRFSVPRGIPVSARFHRVLYNTASSYKAIGGWSAALSARGDIVRRLTASAKGSSGGASVASAGDNVPSTSGCDVAEFDETDGMPLKSMIGPFAITLLFCVIGIFQHCTAKTAKKLEQRAIEPAAEKVGNMLAALEQRLHTELDAHLSKQHESLHQALDHHFSKQQEAQKIALDGHLSKQHETIHEELAHHFSKQREAKKTPLDTHVSEQRESQDAPLDDHLSEQREAKESTATTLTL